MGFFLELIHSNDVIISMILSKSFEGTESCSFIGFVDKK